MVRRNKAMATIRDNIDKVEKAMGVPANKAGLGLVLKNAAIDAIMEGPGPEKEKWQIYMSMFADNQEQLDRLTIVDPANDPPWLNEARAYVMSNAVCAPNTNTKTGNGIFNTPIETALDNGISSVSEGANGPVRKLRPPDFAKFVK
jgi:hypothetical protein